MCKFCEGLFDNRYSMEWLMRSSYADDNFCEKVFNDSCENCKECNHTYRLKGYKINNNSMLINEYEFNNGDIKIWNSSEALHINYCPYCGKQISKDIVKYDDIHNHVSDIYDNDGDSWDYENYTILKELGFRDWNVNKKLKIMDNCKNAKIVACKHEYNPNEPVRCREISIYEIERMIEDGIDINYCDKQTQDYINNKLNDLRKQREINFKED